MTNDPIKQKRERELELWHHWNNNGKTPEHLEPLLASLAPMISRETDKQLVGTGGSISPYALRQTIQNMVVKQLHSYSPEKGKLSTHIVNGFRRTSDAKAKWRNAKSISRADFEKYKTFENAKSELEESLGRDATPEELSSHLGWKGPAGVKKVKGLLNTFVSELSTGIGGVEINADNALNPQMAYSVVRASLPARHQNFGDAYFNTGANTPSIERMAKTLNISPHQARRMRADIEAKMKKILGGQ